VKPRSINIFLLDGDPNGIRVAQISMSTIQAIAFRRNQLRRVRDAFPEIERPGVYILIGADENEPDRQLAYIGESEGVGARLSYHNSNELGRDAKGFWTDTVVLISKDENLTKSHARYVEPCLIRSVGGNPRWSLPNSRRPSEDAGKLPLPDRAAMDEFVDQTKTLVGALGWDLFRQMRGVLPKRSRSFATFRRRRLSEVLFSFSGERASASARDGRRAKIAGLILMRQHPGTAKGVMSITLEDETGIANLIVWPKLFEAQRRVILAARMLGVEGRVQREGDAVHFIASRVVDLSHALAGIERGGGVGA
jgi:hypothetical protein